MKKTAKKKKPISAEQIARMASQGKDVSRFFTRRLGMVHPLLRVTVDFSGAMLAELDAVAKELNISREGLIKTLVREGFDRRYLRTRVTAKPGQGSHAGRSHRAVTG
jgi:hypothetical protein